MSRRGRRGAILKGKERQKKQNQLQTASIARAPAEVDVTAAGIVTIVSRRNRSEGAVVIAVQLTRIGRGHEKVPALRQIGATVAESHIEATAVKGEKTGRLHKKANVTKGSHDDPT